MAKGLRQGPLLLLYMMGMVEELCSVSSPMVEQAEEHTGEPSLPR